MNDFKETRLKRSINDMVCTAILVEEAGNVIDRIIAMFHYELEKARLENKNDS